MVLLSLLGGLAALAWFDNEANRGITFVPSPTPIPYANGPQIGVNAYNLQAEVDQAKVRQTLEQARDLGARYVRIQMPWQDIEIHAKGDFTDRRNPQKGTISAWAKYDFLLGEMRRLKLEPIARLDRPPDWARTKALATPEWQAIVSINANASGPPDNYADYADFVAAVAQRYRGELRFIQLWNEPNLADEWNGQRPDPIRFLDLLRQASIAARAANAQAVVLFPSLAPTDGLDPRAPLTDLAFLDSIYTMGGGQYFDIMSAQAYGLGQPPDEHRYVRLRPRTNWSWRQPIDTRIDVSRLPLLREVMEQHGDNNKAIWISEFGYVSAPAELPQLWGPPVSEEQKGAYLVQQIERARDEWSWVGVMNLWILRWGGAPPDPADPTAYFALVDHDFKPLPSYTAIQQFLAQPAVAGVGAHTPDHPAVEQIAGGLRIRFRGTALALRGDGTAQVTIDGGAPNSYALADVETTVARGLAYSTHTVEIIGTEPHVFVVSREQPWAWFWNVAPIVLISAIATVGALVATGFMR